MLGWFESTRDKRHRALLAAGDEGPKEERVAKPPAASGGPPPWNQMDVDKLLESRNNSKIWADYIEEKRNEAYAKKNPEPYLPNFKTFDFRPYPDLVIGSAEVRFPFRKALLRDEDSLMDLMGSDFSQCRFSSVTFANVNLAGCTFRGASFEGPRYSIFHRCSTNTRHSDPGKTQYHLVYFDEIAGTPASFEQIKIERKNHFVQLFFLSSQFDFDTFASTNLSDCVFTHCQLPSANFSNCDLKYASFRGSNLRMANFEKADLEGANVLLDLNNIDGARFGPYSTNAWLELVRTFTGFSLIINFLLLVAYFTPLIAKAAFLNMIFLAEGSDAIKKMAESRCDGECPQSIVLWEALGGLDAPLNVGVALFLLLYNILRIDITNRVSKLQEESQRSKYAPALKNYKWMIGPSNVLRWLFWFTVGFSALTYVSILFHVVPSLK